MRALSSRQIGDVFTAIRDHAPQHGREVRLVVKARTDFDGPIKRPSRKVPKPRALVQTDKAAHMAEQRAQLKQILRHIHFGTSPKLRVRAKPEPVKPAPEPVPVLLLTDQRSARRKRLVQTEILGPVPNPLHMRRIAQINAQMAVQYGPWQPHVARLAYEVISL
jgi:hypothetical protein